MTIWYFFSKVVPIWQCRSYLGAEVVVVPKCPIIEIATEQNASLHRDNVDRDNDFQ